MLFIATMAHKISLTVSTWRSTKNCGIYCERNTQTGLTWRQCWFSIPVATKLGCGRAQAMFMYGVHVYVSVNSW